MNSTDNQKDQSETQATVIINLEQLVKNHITQISTLKDQIKKHKEMLDSIFLNDATYQEHEKKAKEVNKQKTVSKNELLKRTDVAEVNSKYKELKIQLKELQTALTEYVREYQRMTGVNEIENEKGEVMEIIYTVKLVKKSSRIK